MIDYYLRTALRHFFRFKYSTIANVLCLSFGMTCFLCAYSVFAYFASCESGFTNSKNVYVINTTIKKASDDPTVVSGILPGMMKYIKSDMPELKVSFTSNLLGTIPRKVTVGDRKIDWFRPFIADNQFLGTLDIPMISGDRATALSAPNSIVIGADAAIKLFGSTDVIGKVVHLADMDVTITGVLGPLPVPTHLAMLGNQGADGKHYVEGLIPWQVQEKLMMSNDIPAQGAATSSVSFDQIMETFQTPVAMAYITLPTDSSIDVLNRKLNALFERHVNEKVQSADDGPIRYSVKVVPVRQVLSTFVDSTSTLLGMPLKGLLTLCGVIVLGVAIVNYANLYTTQLVSSRSELHVQRLLGAARTQLAIQCFVETLLASILALILAVFFFEPLKPPITDNSFVEFNTQWLSGWHYGLILVGLVLTVSILASLYPVIYVLQIKPRLQQRTSNTRWSARSAVITLVATQFSITGALLIFLQVVGQQNAELKRLALSHIDDPVVIVNNTLNENNVSYTALVAGLKQYPQVKSVATVNGLWVQGFSFEPNTVATEKGSAAARHRVDVENISFGFLNTMNMKLLAGRDFDRTRDRPPPEVQDATEKEITSFVPNVIVDRSLVDALGYRNTEDVIGKELHGHGFGQNSQSSVRVIGVVENIYLGMMGTRNVGTVFMVSKDRGFPLIRVDKRDIKGGLHAVNTVWKQLAPNLPANVQFLEERYTTPAFIARAFWILSILLTLSITISLLGMIGITLHTLSRRTREISIRKSLGASNADILKLLLGFFAKPVVIANILLAWPLGYLLCRAYLGLFPYRVALSPWPFVASLLITLIFVLLAIAAQSIRAAYRNPAEILRHE